jgi:hypothetical protein
MKSPGKSGGKPKARQAGRGASAPSKEPPPSSLSERLRGLKDPPKHQPKQHASAAAARRPAAKTMSHSRGGRRMRPMVLMIGADKGGVGKTTIARTVLDYLVANDVPARAFDSEYPRGTLARFHPKATDVVDITAAADQMKMLDTLAETDAKVTVIDIRAGLLSRTLKAFTDVGFFDLVRSKEFDFGLFHVVGPSVSSLEEIGEVAPYAEGRNYFVVKNFINETSFFDWNPQVYKGYLKGGREAVEVTIPKLNEMACEQVELAGIPFSTFIANRNGQGAAAAYSLVLRGYVRTWLNQISGEYDRVGLIERLTDRAAA